MQKAKFKVKNASTDKAGLKEHKLKENRDGNCQQGENNGDLNKVRPYIEMHKGNVFLENVTEKSVILRIREPVAHCGLADLTYNYVISGLIKEAIPKLKRYYFSK